MLCHVVHESNDGAALKLPRNCRWCETGSIYRLIKDNLWQCETRAWFTNASGDFYTSTKILHQVFHKVPV